MPAGDACRRVQDIAAGRQVRKGERAIKILGYQEDRQDRPGHRRRGRGPAGAVSGAVGVRHLPNQERPLPDSGLPSGAGPDGALDRLTGRLTGEGWTLRELPLGETCEGYTDHAKRTIVTESNLAPATRWSCLHEAAHAVLHGGLAPGEYQAHRGVDAPKIGLPAS